MLIEKVICFTVVTFWRGKGILSTCNTTEKKNNTSQNMNNRSYQLITQSIYKLEAVRRALTLTTAVQTHSKTNATSALKF